MEEKGEKGKRGKSFGCNSYHLGAAAPRQFSLLDGGTIRPVLVVSMSVPWMCILANVYSVE